MQVKRCDRTAQVDVGVIAVDAVCPGRHSFISSVPLLLASVQVKQNEATYTDYREIIKGEVFLWSRE